MIRQIGIFILCYLCFDCSPLVLTLGQHQEKVSIKECF